MKTVQDIFTLTNRPVGKSTLRRLFLALIIFIAILAIFTYVAREVFEGETLKRDTQLLLFINSLSNTVLDKTMLTITTLGDVSSVLTITAFVLVILYWKKRWQAFALLFFSMTGAAALNVILKLIFERQRPHLWNLLIHESTYSFPSGHAMLTSSLVLALILIMLHTSWRWWVIGIGSTYVILVGLSRMYLGVHYPTDVFAGWCVSAIWVIVVATILGTVNWRNIKLKSSENQAATRTQ